jgi:hypothetical protein
MKVLAKLGSIRRDNGNFLKNYVNLRNITLEYVILPGITSFA